jgi:hypothetical protein
VLVEPVLTEPVLAEPVLIEEGAPEPLAEEGTDPPAAPIVPWEAHAVSENPVRASNPGITLARSRTVMIHPLWKVFGSPALRGAAEQYRRSGPALSSAEP